MRESDPGDEMPDNVIPMRRGMKFPINITMKTTALVTTILVITLGIYDLIAVVISGNETISVSRFLINAGFQAPVFVFMVGFCCGHVFGYAKPFKAKE